MHGPSATPLLVELATVALVLAVSLARKPLARLARRRAPAPAPRITSRLTGARDHS
jgi:hypothetical protein